MDNKRKRFGRFCYKIKENKMKTFFIINLLLIGFLLSCNLDNKPESVLSNNVEIEKSYILVIRAYQVGYLMGRLEGITDDRYTTEDLERSTLEYIQSIGLGPKYYIYAK